jgi:hypothetical protein
VASASSRHCPSMRFIIQICDTHWSHRTENHPSLARGQDGPA